VANNQKAKGEEYCKVQDYHLALNFYVRKAQMALKNSAFETVNGDIHTLTSWLKALKYSDY
jgi:hypothetical protein